MISAATAQPGMSAALRRLATKHHEISGLKLLPVLFFLAVSTLYGQSPDAACTMCHGNNTLSMTRQGRSVSLFVDSAKLQSSAHGTLSCSSCHVNFNGMAIPHANPIQPVNCESCHNVGGFAESVHAKSGVATCKSCHGTHEVQPVKSPASGFARTMIADACGKCHATESSAYKNSEHALALDRMPQSPTCTSCHGAHTVIPAQSAESPLRRNNEPAFCLSCHLKDPEMRKQPGFSEHFMSGYESSVHGQARAAGNDKSATCGSCHGSHDILSAQKPAAMTNRLNIDGTCGTCHADASANYKDSSHGQAAARGNAEAPTCTTCHGDHHIYSAQDPRSAVSRANIEQTCVTCHNAMKSRQEYGTALSDVNFFFNSFHGIPSKSGLPGIPTCANCHGTHGIKPASDPGSPVNPNNLVTTCGNCHPGANATFVSGKVHTLEISVVPYWIRNIYIVLIVVTIGMMFLHNLLDFIRQMQRRSEIRRGLRPPAVHGTRRFVRMTLLDRVQHVGLLVSFLTLTVTGFMLRFPDAWWVSIIKSTWTQFFEMRGYIHRGAAAVLVLFSLFHVCVLIFTRHGRKFAWDMFPKWSDVKDVFANMRYLLGLSSEKARFDRFSYGEKAEYWALVWGTVIMAVSGIFLWFFIYFMNHFGKIGWEIARTVHFYEAILAALAIVVWHFYFVMFSPGIFPMNTTWITGKVSEEEMAEEHPLELERILQQEQEAQEPPHDGQ